MKDFYQLVRLRGLCYVVAFLSRDVISASRWFWNAITS